jgi:bacterioferritin
MKGSDVVLQHLQRAIIMELTTVNTYTRQARQLADWGVDRLARRMDEEIEEERGHAHRFIDRMLFLEGTPDVHALDRVEPDGSVRAVFETQMRMEHEAREFYAKARSECSDAGDPATAHLFREILEDEEEHIDFIETQFSLMEMMGEQLYIARHVSSEAEED